MPDGYSTMPSRAEGRIFEAVRRGDGVFDAEAWHVMDRRDNALIEQEILHGAGSTKFVYAFSIKGTTVTGISVVGARHLAAHYGGIKHTLIGSIQKTGSLFIFTSFPQVGIPMAVQCSSIQELAQEPDFYGAIVEVKDIKSGNSVQIEVRENRYEKTKGGSTYERPHYPTIAQSKAYRNGVLSLIPQDVQISWKEEMLKLDKKDIITEAVIDLKRAGVLRFAAAKAISLDRRLVETLTLDQISGLADAAREDRVSGFASAAEALGVTGRQATAEPMQAPAKAVPAPSSKPLPQAPKASPAPEKAQATENSGSGFEAQLVDEVGEALMEPTTDPAAFARALADQCRGATPDSREAIIANNDEAISAARKVPTAAKILEELDSSPRPTAPLGMAPIEIPVERGKPQWPAYFGAIKEAAHGITEREAFERFVEINAEQMSGAPHAQRLLAVKSLTVHAGALGLRLPILADLAQATPALGKAQDAAVAPQEGLSPEQEARRWADSAMADIDKQASTDSLDDVLRNVAMQRGLDRLRRNFPAIADEVDRAITSQKAILAQAEQPR